jgi:DNA (cytosine-5)-methyltransferase 1
VRGRAAGVRDLFQLPGVVTMGNRFGSLFSGVGGMDKGLEDAGWECAFQIELDPYCAAVLEKHWPNVPRFGDITEVDPDELPACDLLAGGFPCQPVSVAGPRRGTADPRWLWPAFARLIGALRPRLVLVENVPGLIHRGLDVVLSDLAALGFDAEWSVLSACALGAPHTRERLFIVAYPARDRWVQGRALAGADFRMPSGCRDERRPHWRAEPDVDRVVSRVPRRVDRLRGLGNAVTPQVAGWIGRQLLEG